MGKRSLIQSRMCCVPRMCQAWCQVLGIQWRASPGPVLEEHTVGVTKEESGHESTGLKELLPGGPPETTGSSKEEASLVWECKHASRRRGRSKLRSKGK